MFLDYYKILGVAADDPRSKIAQRYAELKVKLDHHCETEDDKKGYARIMEAYLVLGNPVIRGHYDKIYNEVKANQDSNDAADTISDPELEEYLVKAKQKVSESIVKIKPASYWEKRSQRKKKIKISIFGVLCILVICLIFKANFCFVPGYHRAKSCILNGTNLKGDIVKMEVINSSTIPIGEMSQILYDNRTTLDIRQGNVAIDFDKEGNIKKYKGYTAKGKSLFEVDDFDNSISDSLRTAPVPLGRIDTAITDYKVSLDKKDRVRQIEYFSGKKKLYDVHVKFNDNDDPVFYTKEYCDLSFKIGDHEIKYIDSTFISYKEYDKNGNWTLAEYEHKGQIKRHHFKFHVKRQFTYNCSWKKSKLIKQLPDFISKEDSDMSMPSLSKRNYDDLEIGIPQNFVPFSYVDIEEASKHIPINIDLSHSLANFQTLDNMQFAMLQVSRFEQTDSSLTEYDLLDVDYVDALTDIKYRDIMTYNLSLSNIQMIYWENSRIERIGDKKALTCSYYYQAPGSVVPSYSTIYIIPIEDRKSLCINYCYSTAQGYYFQKLFDKVIASASFQ